MPNALCVKSALWAAGCASSLFLVSGAIAQEKVHFTYLWHLEQPIYWPDQKVGSPDRYETAADSIFRVGGGGSGQHPENNLNDIFGLDDRKNVYQWRVKDSIGAISGKTEAGAQISYSGGLIENIASLGANNMLGYSSSWNSHNQTARNWYTNRGASSKRRLDIVLFSFHHALLPLCDENTIRKEIQLYKSIYPDAWGGGGVSAGFFPSEMAFSTRMIPALAAEGVQWSIVSGEKISRACSNFPVVLGSGGINTDPPNLADQLNPAQTDYLRLSIDRGCSPAEAYPYAFTPRRARFVNPSTGAISSIIVVPASQSLGWKDGYAPIGTGFFDTLQTKNDGSRPQLVVLAHDGDNAWGGGYSYYMEATPNLVNSASSAGYVPTVIEQYLADHPVPANDYVHVEDGAWVNADGDFGSPQMINWNWPLLSSSGQIDVTGGWHEDARNWAVITAAQNRVDTAEQIAGGVNIRKILYPDATTTAAERAWHYFLGSLNSGYMYYGTSLDMEVKPTVACNEAVQHADTVIGSGTADATGPSIWPVQRQPWNPGSANFGPQYGYQSVINNGDFHIWTFAYDVSGISTVTLKYRVDADGTRSLSNTENETFAGGPGVGAWQSLPMTKRVFPAGNVYNNPSINFFEMPQYIADQYYVQVTGLRSKLIDYYVEAVDTRGNIKRSAIEHVYIGSGQGGGNGGNTPVVQVNPATPVAGQNVTITYNPSGRVLAGANPIKIHYGFNNWASVISPDPTMTYSSSAGTWSITVPVASTATQLDFVFNNGASTWDNNNGADWHYIVTGGQAGQTWTMDGVRDTDSKLIASNNGMNLWAGLKGDTLYVATNDAGEGNDHFIFVASNPAGALRAAPWAKAGQVANWLAFLADENDNTYNSWFDTTVTRASATGANGGVLEGTIDLKALFGGVLPNTIALAVGPYGNADGGALVKASQVPASVNNDNNLDASEFAIVEVCSLTAAGCSTPCAADFNNDGFLDFTDFDAFVAAFEAGGAAGDFNKDGFIDFTDFDAYVSAFEAGC